MANRYATKSGNWSDVTVWDGGTTLPGAGDVVRPNSYTVTIDQDVTVAELRNDASSPAVAGGGFLISSITDTRTLTWTNPLLTRVASNTILTCTALTGSLIINGSIKGGTLTDGWTFRLIGCTTLSVIINGNIEGGTGNYALCIYISGTSSNLNIVVNGNVWGGTSSDAALYLVSTIGSLTVNGNLTAGSGSYGAIFAVASVSGSFVINGNVVGSTGSCVYITNGNAIVDINGSVTSTTNGFGAYLLGPSNVRVKGPLYNAPNGRAAVVTAFLKVPEDENVQWHCTDDSLYPLTGAPVVLSNFVSDSPPPEDVREGTVYGVNGALAGTAVIPSPASVRAGVPVDTTIGTAVVTPADVWDHEIATGVSAKARLMATSTDASTAAILEGALNHDE